MADSPVWDVKRMRPVVLEWEAALIAELPAYARLIPEAESRGSVLRPPATEGEIAAAEARLGVMLPPSYRSFLSIANGADAAGDSADYVTRLDARQRRGLRGIQDVGALGDELDWLVPIWRARTLHQVAAAPGTGAAELSARAGILRVLEA